MALKRIEDFAFLSLVYWDSWLRVKQKKIGGAVRNQAIDSGLVGVYNQGKEDIKEII
jgi:hypothetical protein